MKNKVKGLFNKYIKCPQCKDTIGLHRIVPFIADVPQNEREMVFLCRKCNVLIEMSVEHFLREYNAKQ